MHDSPRPQVYHHTDNIIAACAPDSDPSHKILEYLNLSNYQMLYGRFTKITKIGQCTHSPDRTHWIIEYANAGPE
jgi:hypothetical protein